MLRAVPKGWFSWDFSIFDATRNPVANIDVSAWREKATLEVGFDEYRVYREGLMSGAFILESAGSVLARAEKPSAFRRAFVVGHGGREYTLRARSAFRRECILLDGEREIGSIRPEGPLTRRAEVRLPEDLPLPVRVFLVWLVVILWKRDAESAAASS